VKDGLEALPDIRSASPGAKIVMLSGFEASRLETTALESGAAAYLEKGIPPRELVVALLDVLQPDDPGSANNGNPAA
ncbi:MAG: response regulator, partial [Actinomycetota bacterium]|nr:response regulator [Actinomycetota bacterium]